MPSITIEAIEEKQTELGKLIQQFKKQSKSTIIKIEGRSIELYPGERYSGARLDEQGNHLHHVIVLADRPKEKQNWKDSLKWGVQCSGEVASPEEYALIKANCPDLLTESWYWTNKAHESDASCAWFFYSYGRTLLDTRSAAGGALAVRRA